MFYSFVFLFGDDRNLKIIEYFLILLRSLLFLFIFSEFVLLLKIFLEALRVIYKDSLDQLTSYSIKHRELDNASLSAASMWMPTIQFSLI